MPKFIYKENPEHDRQTSHAPSASELLAQGQSSIDPSQDESLYKDPKSYFDEKTTPEKAPAPHLSPDELLEKSLERDKNRSLGLLAQAMSFNWESARAFSKFKDSVNDTFEKLKGKPLAQEFLISSVTTCAQSVESGKKFAEECKSLSPEEVLKKTQARSAQIEQSVFEEVSNTGMRLEIDKEAVRTIAKVVAFAAGMTFFVVGILMGGLPLATIVNVAAPSATLMLVTLTALAATFASIALVYKLKD